MPTTRKRKEPRTRTRTRREKDGLRAALRRLRKEIVARADGTRGRELRAIDAALKRLARGTYGTCARCKKSIPFRRLAGAPALLHCARCARQIEDGADRDAAKRSSSTPRVQLPADLRLLSDRELAETVRELLRDNGRIDMDELRITCRHSVIYVTGTLPSEAERQIVRKLLTDVEGLEEIVERVGVSDLPWERDDRVETALSSLEDIPEDLFEATHTHDAIRSEEEGIAYEPPEEPPPDE